MPRTSASWKIWRVRSWKTLLLLLFFLSLVIKVDSWYWCLPEFILNMQAGSESPTSIKLLRRREPGLDSLQAFVRCEENWAGRGVSIKGANNSACVRVCRSKRLQIWFHTGLLLSFQSTFQSSICRGQKNDPFQLWTHSGGKKNRLLFVFAIRTNWKLLVWVIIIIITTVDLYERAIRLNKTKHA